MGHRTYTDTSGVVWNVWDVTPQWTERRSGGDRRRADSKADANPPLIERRRQVDRRAEAEPSSRIRIAEGLSRGWLAFESANDRRRLVPIPPGWESLSDAELEALCARASPTSARRRLIE